MLPVNRLDYKSLFDYNPDAILALDVNGWVIQTNNSVLTTLGYNTGELLSAPYEKIIHPGHLKQAQAFFNQVILGTAQEFDTIAFHKNRDEVNLRVKTIPIVLNGKIQGAYWIAKDLTSLKKVEKVLSETQNTLVEVFKHTADAINILDLQGNVLQVNPAFEDLYGWKQNEILGSPLPHIPPDRAMEPLEFLHKIKQGDTIKNYETNRVSKEGSNIEINLTYTPINDLNGNLAAIAGIARDMTEKRKFEERNKFLAFHDSLTGLPNRRFIDDLLERTIKEGTQHNRNFALLYMDVDNFKRVNDTYGHDAGDELLKQFAQRVKTCINETDVMARIGGDEFTILLSESIDVQSAALVAERILETLKQPWQINQHELITTSSMGITLNRENDDEKNILKRADLALYQAKEKGKSTYQFYL